MSGPPEILNVLERRLAALRKARPDQEEALAVQGLLIRAALTAARAPEAVSFPLPRDHLSERIREGVPLLHDQPIHIDIPFAADLFSRLVTLLGERHDPDLEGRLGALIGATTAGLLDPERLFGEAFVQHTDHLADIAVAARVDAELLATIASQSVAPLLRAYAAGLLPLVSQVDHAASGAEWNRGYCPICGGWPLLGELRGVELAQWLRCSACGSGWRSQRMFCPYCANIDYHSLGSLAIEGEPRFRIAVCERCHGYLKVANAFDPSPPELLALDDVASVHLDVAAIERGYRRPGGSGFVIELALPETEWVEEFA